jgi:hypothetical protein
VNDLIAARCIARYPHALGAQLIYDLGNSFGLSAMTGVAAGYSIALVRDVRPDGQFLDTVALAAFGRRTIHEFGTAAEANDFIARAFAWADETRRVAETETAALFVRLGVNTKEN